MLEIYIYIYIYIYEPNDDEVAFTIFKRLI